MASAAVLDRETGLVWEKVPSTARFTNWMGASSHCLELTIGGRRGWRLPTIQDLLSLSDQTQTNPALPSGHPFTVESAIYWSATSNALNTNNAWLVFLSSGFVDFFGKTSGPFLAWCVRGGPGVDPQ